MNQLPTSRNQETPFKKKKTLDFQLLLENWKMWLALQSCLVKGKAQQQGPHGRGVAVLCATTPVTPHWSHQPASFISSSCLASRTVAFTIPAFNSQSTQFQKSNNKLKNSVTYQLTEYSIFTSLIHRVGKINNHFCLLL